MKKKVCAVLTVLAFVSVASFHFQLQSSSTYQTYNSNDNNQEDSPVLPVYGPEPKPAGYGEPVVYGPQPKPAGYVSSPPPPPGSAPTFSGQNRQGPPGPPPPPGKRSQTGPPGQPGQQNRDVAVVNTVVDGVVAVGDHLITSYTDKASHMVNRALGKESTKEQLQADKTMLNNATQVGDDTVGLLEARDREQWHRFIDDEFNKDPSAMVEALLPLVQFHPDDVKELSQYIADKRATLGVRSIISGVANTPYWGAAQEDVAYAAGEESWINSPEAKAIKQELKEHFSRGAKKAGQALYKESEEKAEEAAKNWAKRTFFGKQ